MRASINIYKLVAVNVFFLIHHYFVVFAVLFAIQVSMGQVSLKTHNYSMAIMMSKEFENISL